MRSRQAEGDRLNVGIENRRHAVERQLGRRERDAIGGPSADDREAIGSTTASAGKRQPAGGQRVAMGKVHRKLVVARASQDLPLGQLGQGNRGCRAAGRVDVNIDAVGVPRSAGDAEGIGAGGEFKDARIRRGDGLRTNARRHAHAGKGAGVQGRNGMRRNRQPHERRVGHRYRDG